MYHFSGFLHIVSLALLILFCAACSNDDATTTPNVLTEMVMAETDAAGKVWRFTTDGDSTFTVNNTITSEYYATTLRCLCMYAACNATQADVYQIKRVTIFQDYARKACKKDPTGIQSAWLSKKFINFHLYPKTKGGKQAWGYLRDSTRSNATGGTSYYLSLYHDQEQDTVAFSTHFYASIPLDSIAPIRTKKDSIHLAVQTYGGVWKMGYGL